ncbi:MAG: hypothetical protein HC919_01040 [Oscillatoriales cyanobacterium SM2_2_1]|nr:hypothetical protein [Oscillatoriales cyanobacterium SM2_2_1]
MAAIIGALLIPLGTSFERLRLELGRKQQQSETLRLARQLWQERLIRSGDGQPRSVINRLNATLQGEQLVVELTVITTQSLSLDEQEKYAASLAAALGRSRDSLRLDLIEIPTVPQNLTSPTADLFVPEQPKSAAEQQAEVLSRFDRQIRSLPLPGGHQMVEGRITFGAIAPWLLS